jgi:hypothetical protein
VDADRVALLARYSAITGIELAAQQSSEDKFWGWKIMLKHSFICILCLVTVKTKFFPCLNQQHLQTVTSTDVKIISGAKLISSNVASWGLVADWLVSARCGEFRKIDFSRCYGNSFLWTWNIPQDWEELVCTNGLKTNFKHVYVQVDSLHCTGKVVHTKEALPTHQ